MFDQPLLLALGVALTHLLVCRYDTSESERRIAQWSSPIPHGGIVGCESGRAGIWPAIETERAEMSAIGHASSRAGAVTWEILWALILGFFLSAVVQAVVRRATVVGADGQ
jgi:hypothetical protein